MVKQPKGGVIFQILIVAVFTIISGGIVGGLVGCAIGLFCSTGGNSGFTPTSNNTCISAPNSCGQTTSGSITTTDTGCPDGYAPYLNGAIVPWSSSVDSCVQVDSSGNIIYTGESGTPVTVSPTTVSSCNATPPPDSQCSCSSPANACGQTAIGSYDPNGTSCNAATPPNNSCPPPVIAASGFSATPSTIGPNQTTTLNWNTTNSTSCTITGDNGFSQTGGASGSITTGALTQTTTFTLVCEDGTGGPTASRTIKVIIDPHYQEI